MVMDWIDFVDVSLPILSSLNAKDLARMEEAGKVVDRKTISVCQEALVSRARNDLSRRPWLLLRVKESSTRKHLLKELLHLKQYVDVVPTAWSPQIIAVNPVSLQLSPVVESARSNDALAHLGHVAQVPLALGVKPGKTMSVGLHIQSERGHASECVCLGLEFQLGISLFFAPLTGVCTMKFPGDAGKLVVEAMPALANEHCACVEVFLNVSETGDLEFIRYCKASSSMFRSGAICRNMFPFWNEEAFAFISIQAKQVSCKTQVSTKWSIDGLPQEIIHRLENMPSFIIDGTWKLG